MARRVWPGVASLYKGVVGAASGAGIYIGTYFAFYGTACNVLSSHSNLTPGGIAFVAGGIAAAGGSVVKVPLAVCIRSVQARPSPSQAMRLSPLRFRPTPVLCTREPFIIPDIF